MHELISRLPLRVNEYSLSSFRCNALAVISRQDQPACLVDQPIMPVLLPISNVPNILQVRTPGYLKHMIDPVLRELGIAVVTPEDLFQGFRASEVFHHLWVTQELFEKR